MCHLIKAMKRFGEDILQGVPKMAKANWLEEIEKKKINNNNLKCLDNVIK